MLSIQGDLCSFYQKSTSHIEAEKLLKSNIQDQRTKEFNQIQVLNRIAWRRCTRDFFHALLSSTAAKQSIHIVFRTLVQR